MEGQAGLRVSLSELAGIKQCSVQNISKRLKRLEADELIKVGRRGREKVVSLAEWDQVTGEMTDPARLVAQETRKIAGALDEPVAGNIEGGKQPNDPTYLEQLRRKVGFEADKREIEIKQLRGELLPIEDVRQAMERCAEAMVRDIDQIPSFADDIAVAMTRGGAAAVRDVLKAKARELRGTLERSMTLIEKEDEEEIEEASEAA